MFIMVVFSAIRINENNIKAYYRQVLGLKEQKKHAEALKVAEMGYLKQPSVSITFLPRKLDPAYQNCVTIEGNLEKNGHTRQVVFIELLLFIATFSNFCWQ